MSDWGRWVPRLLLAGAAIVTGAFARRTYDAKVRQIGRAFQAGERTLRGGVFACEACGARFTLAAGDAVDPCRACGHPRSTKMG
jgi:hypothetical protein